MSLALLSHDEFDDNCPVLVDARFHKDHLLAIGKGVGVKFEVDIGGPGAGIPVQRNGQDCVRPFVEVSVS